VRAETFSPASINAFFASGRLDSRNGSGLALSGILAKVNEASALCRQRKEKGKGVHPSVLSIFKWVPAASKVSQGQQLFATRLSIYCAFVGGENNHCRRRSERDRDSLPLVATLESQQNIRCNGSRSDRITPCR